MKDRTSRGISQQRQQRRQQEREEAALLQNEFDDILSNFQKAQRCDGESYKAWHAWALAN